MTLYNNVCNWIISHIKISVVNKIAVIVILIYYYIGLLSYITVPFPQIFRLFKPNSGIAIGLRAFMVAIICLYSLLVLCVYKKKFPWRWLVAFSFVLLGTLFTMIISPQVYKYVYIESLYKVVHLVQLSQGLNKNIVMFLSAIADFAFAFCALFIMPYALNNKRQLLFLLVPIVFIGCLECCYSIIKEKDIYIYLINNSDDIFGGYGHEAGATFGNKEDWGAFLTLSFVCAIASSFFIKKDKKYKWIIAIMFWACALIFSVFAVLSLCKTAMLGIFLSLVILFIGLWYLSFKKGKVTAILYSIIASLIIIIVVMFFALPQLHSYGIFKKIYDFVNRLIFERTDKALDGRTSLWMNFVQNLRSYNFFFGFGKNGVAVYTTTLSPEGQSTMHNGIFYFLGSYGLFGFILLIICLLRSLIAIFKVWKINQGYVFLFISAFLSCMAFVLNEAEVLIFSTSNPIFVYNILLVVFPSGLIIKEKNVNKCEGLVYA